MDRERLALVGTTAYILWSWHHMLVGNLVVIYFVWSMYSWFINGLFGFTCKCWFIINIRMIYGLGTSLLLLAIVLNNLVVPFLLHFNRMLRLYYWFMNVFKFMGQFMVHLRYFEFIVLCIYFGLWGVLKVSCCLRILESLFKLGLIQDLIELPLSLLFIAFNLLDIGNADLGHL